MAENKVNRTDELLYGGAAELVRKLGLGATITTEAREVVTKWLQESHEADTLKPARAELIAGITKDSVPGNHQYDAEGRSPHTLWLEDLYGAMYDLEQHYTRVFRGVAQEAALREERARQGVDSLRSFDTPAASPIVVTGGHVPASANATEAARSIQSSLRDHDLM